VEPGDRLLSVAEAGEYLGTGQRFVRLLIYERRIAFHHIGKHVKLKKSDLDAFIEAGRVEPD
jgi:excisionase family DNA binding protein